MNTRPSDPKALRTLTPFWDAADRRLVLRLGTTDLWGWNIPCCGGPSCDGRSLRHLRTVGTRPSCDNQNYLQTPPDVFLAGPGWQRRRQVRATELHPPRSPLPEPPRGAAHSPGHLSTLGRATTRNRRLRGRRLLFYHICTFRRRPVPRPRGPRASHRAACSRPPGTGSGPRAGLGAQTFSRRGRCSSSAASLGGIS